MTTPVATTRADVSLTGFGKLKTFMRGEAVEVEVLDIPVRVGDES